MTTQGSLSTHDVANRLTSLCRSGKVQEAGEELYADNIVSVEPPQSAAPLTNGRKAVLEKGKQFAASIEEWHSGSFGDPIVVGNHFAMTMVLDATLKGLGRKTLEEICVYEVKDGKIVREQFIY